MLTIHLERATSASAPAIYEQTLTPERPLLSRIHEFFIPSLWVIVYTTHEYAKKTMTAQSSWSILHILISNEGRNGWLDRGHPLWLLDPPTALDPSALSDKPSLFTSQCFFTQPLCGYRVFSDNAEWLGIGIGAMSVIVNSVI